MRPLLLPWQHVFGRAIRRDRVLQNSYDDTVTSFLNQSQQTFVILLENTKLYLFSKFEQNRTVHVPLQHILETVLMRNGAIQLSNYVTVTLFLNLSLQTFEFS